MNRLSDYWIMMNWHDFATFILIGLLSLLVSLLASALLLHMRGRKLVGPAVHQAWTGYCIFAGIGLGMTLAIRGIDEDLNILSQFFLMFAGLFAFIRLGWRSLTGMDQAEHEKSRPLIRGFAPDWRCHPTCLLRTIFLSLVVTLIGWWILRGGPRAPFFVL